MNYLSKFINLTISYKFKYYTKIHSNDKITKMNT